MSIHCLIIDDEPLAAELIADYVGKIPLLTLVTTCNNAIEAIEVIKNQQIDLLFLDIQMPMITGIEFLRSLINPPKVIFTTAYREYALESYELDVVDYLLKPISFERFFKAINKYQSTVEVKMAKSATTDEPEDYMYINANKKHHKVLYSDILYAESLKDYLRIHTVQNSITTKQKISDLEKSLPSYFLRTHRSYIINTRKITAFTAQDVEIGAIEIPIGISYKQQVNAALKQ
ncbi:LytR/AlgR family response regulator transcription factor [Eudoraea chungangensis]|uniref:LytR/AlgR family response regulator transcription factor n=1 Tax=Eudoraea chungangensis TaxID=1481905 RepID=UPI0023EAE5DB|nr:LytTR family DNA-binding domain-containing protein [Eudoraea chungangensis]